MSVKFSNCVLWVSSSCVGDSELSWSDMLPRVSCVVFYVDLELECKVEATKKKKPTTVSVVEWPYHHVMVFLFLMLERTWVSAEVTLKTGCFSF